MIDSLELRKALAQNVRRLRVSKGLTQEQLAGEVGISRVHLNRIENAEQLPSLEVSYTLADFLGTDVDSLRKIPAVAA